MKLEDQVCTLGQAKRLKELGVAQESYLYWWVCNNGIMLLQDDEDDKVNPKYSAFTVAELGVMLPDCRCIQNNEDHKFDYWRRNNKWIWAEYENGYLKHGFKVRTFLTEAQAKADILLHLLENNLITAESINQRLQQ